MKLLNKLVLTSVLLSAPQIFAGGDGGSSGGSSGRGHNPSQSRYERTVDRYRSYGFSEENARREANREISRGGNSGVFDREGNRTGRGSTGRGNSGHGDRSGINGSGR